MAYRQNLEPAGLSGSCHVDLSKIGGCAAILGRHQLKRVLPECLSQVISEAERPAFPSGGRSHNIPFALVTEGLQV